VEPCDDKAENDGSDVLHGSSVVVTDKNCSESADVKLNPCHVRICIHYMYYF